MTLDLISPSARCRRYAVLRRGPQPLVRVCWMSFGPDGRIVRGRDDELVPMAAGRRLAAEMAHEGRCDTWIEVKVREG
jgi:hypothetical protein